MQTRWHPLYWKEQCRYKKGETSTEATKRIQSYQKGWNPGLDPHSWASITEFFFLQWPHDFLTLFTHQSQTETKSVFGPQGWILVTTLGYQESRMLILPHLFTVGFKPTTLWDEVSAPQTLEKILKEHLSDIWSQWDYWATLPLSADTKRFGKKNDIQEAQALASDTPRLRP